MTGYLLTKDGTSYKVPKMTSYLLERTNFDECGSFVISFPYTPDMIKILDGVCYFHGFYGTRRVFTGIIDEYTAELGEDICRVIISGRDTAARLTDNEAEAAEFSRCTLKDIIDRYVTPFGISAVGACADSVYGFAVSTGESAFSAVGRFCAETGLKPLITESGVLSLKKSQGFERVLDWSAGAFDVKFKNVRYGIISKAIMKTVSGRRVEVKNEPFIAVGGSAARVRQCTKNTPTSDMEKAGRVIIEKSRRGKITLNLCVCELFAAEPYDRIAVYLDDMGISGTFTVAKARTWADDRTSGTRLYMYREG